jgi:hypothetical protein
MSADVMPVLLALCLMLTYHPADARIKRRRRFSSGTQNAGCHSGFQFHDACLSLRQREEEFTEPFPLGFFI